MKNTFRSFILLFAFCLPAFVFGQNYQEKLNKVNAFLKTFDNGYYGYLEVKDGYLYDRFKSGEYTKTPIEDLGQAKTVETNRKVQLFCKGEKNCVFSTYTNTNHSAMSFSQSTNFNTATLVNLLNDLVAALQEKTIDQNYQAELSKVNAYLKTFDNGYYGYLEVKDGYLYDRFKSGEHTKTAIEDLGQAKTVETSRKVQLFCKGEKECVFSTYTNSNHSAMSFSQSKDFNTSELVTLLNNLVKALQNPNTSTTPGNTPSDQGAANAARLEREKMRPTQQPGTQPTTEKPAPNATKYAASLNALNAYLKIFNSETYGEVSVKEGKVYFEFKVYTKRYYSSIPIDVLTQKTIILQSVGTQEVKIQCKGEADCFYSSYSEDNTDHFRFFSNSVKDLTKMQQLVEDFVNALK